MPNNKFKISVINSNNILTDLPIGFSPIIKVVKINNLPIGFNLKNHSLYEKDRT